MDGAVSGFVLNKLDTLIQKELDLVFGAKHEFKTLRDELRLLQNYINHIYNQKNDSDESVQELVKQLHEASCDAEDAIDLYLYYVAQYKGQHWAKKLLCAGVPVLYRRRQLSIRAQGIKEDINRILKNEKKYNILPDGTSTYTYNVQQAGNVPIPLNRMRTLLAEGADVVGFEGASSEIIKKLIPEQRGDENNDKGMEFRVVSIIGMGGLGKSTLAKKIYDNKNVVGHFTTKIWVVVSQDKNINELLACILKPISKKSPDQNNIQAMRNKLGKKLADKRYLIVLDDIWAYGLWIDLQSCLPADQKNGSRIMLTSRFRDVANAASREASDMYELQPLGEEDSWLLFCKKALKGNACPTNLVELGKDIVLKCKGLPLAIIVLGGFLSAAEITPSFGYWSKLLSDESWHGGCTNILSLSYQCLPFHLKTCYLYIGIFPEDYAISAKNISLLWVAEGFILSREDEEMDDAQKYLAELANRHLIMISQLRFDGSIKSFRIHDLLREFCIKEADKCFLYEVDRNGTFEGVTEVARRLIVPFSKSELKIPFPSLQRLQSLFVFEESHDIIFLAELLNRRQTNLLLACRENFTVGRVLHLEELVILPELGQRSGIKKLALLKYLRVTFKERPSHLAFLCNMLNLQILYLDCAGEYVFSFPSGIWNLKHLKYLKVPHRATIPDARSSDDRMLHLRTLSGIELEKHTLKLISGDRFPKLRKIYLSNNYYNQPAEETILPSLQSLLLLKSVKIQFNSVPTRPLVGAFSQKLTKIVLHYDDATFLTSEHWILLGKLENLQDLELRLKLPTSLLEFKAGAFPQLIFFQLSSGYCEFEIADGALNTLQYLMIKSTINAEHQTVHYLLWSVDWNWLARFLSSEKILEAYEDAKVEESILHYNNVLKGTSTMVDPELQHPSPEHGDDDQHVSCSKSKGWFHIS